MGAKIWDGTKAYLESHGNRVSAPALPDEHIHDLSDHIRRICSLIRKEDTGKVLLAGHSYGGMVISGVAERMPERIRRLVYLDAALPDPGQSLFDLFDEGKVDPLSFVGLEPASAYVEKIRFDPRRIRGLPKTYLLCTKSEFAVVTGVAKQKIATQGDANWTYLELPTSHVPMATMPERFNQLLERIANQ